MQLAELARRLNARLEGSPENPAPETIEVTGVAGIEEAGAHQVTFVANPKYAALTKTTQAAAVLVTEDFPAICSRDLAHRQSRTWLSRAPSKFSISRLSMPRAFTPRPSLLHQRSWAATVMWARMR